jgi:hypothetical protein
MFDKAIALGRWVDWVKAAKTMRSVLFGGYLVQLFGTIRPCRGDKYDETPRRIPFTGICLMINFDIRRPAAFPPHQNFIPLRLPRTQNTSCIVGVHCTHESP